MGFATGIQQRMESEETLMMNLRQAAASSSPSTPIKPRSYTASNMTSNVTANNTSSFDLESTNHDSSSSQHQGTSASNGGATESLTKPTAMPATPTTVNTTTSVSQFSATSAAATADYAAFGLSNDSSLNDVTVMPEDYSLKLVAQVQRRLDTFLAKSPYIQNHLQLEKIPRFTPTHLNLGKTLAKGGFSNIIEINSFNNEECILRPASCCDDSDEEYVVKCLSTRLGLKKLPGATKDIVFEAHTLASLNHPNIIKLRGLSFDGIEGFQHTRRADGFFMILDRLGDTLFTKVFQWQAELKGRGKYAALTTSKKMSLQKIVKQQMQEKIQVCVDVASALLYCHERRICHRDIKSANVAFDRDGKALLIDFGLATELPAVRPGDGPNKAYELVGNIGTARYMAPEVIMERNYNEKADVHSFAVLCWECCAAKKPYSALDAKKVKEHVSKYNERPKPKWSWPRRLRRVLKQGWSKDPKDRPSIAEFRNTLLKVQASLPKSTLDAAKR